MDDAVHDQDSIAGPDSYTIVVLSSKRTTNTVVQANTRTSTSPSSQISTKAGKKGLWKSHLLRLNSMIVCCSPEKAVSTAKLNKEFALALMSLVVVNVIHDIWFMLLHFVLAGLSGWFTILCVPLESYGVSEMHTVAEGLQQPCRTDRGTINERWKA